MSLSIRDFTREEIPVAIAKWIKSSADLEDLEYVRALLYDFANDISSGMWLEDLENENQDWICNK